MLEPELVGGGVEGKGMKVERWISYEDAEGRPESLGGLGGFFDFGMRWSQYAEEGDPHLDALRAEIVRLGLREGGDWHQGECGVPLFSDGTVAKYSYRAWGDLLAAVWSEHDDLDYCYMDFYMGDGTTADRARERRASGELADIVVRRAAMRSVALSPLDLLKSMLKDADETAGDATMQAPPT